ncbi:isoleucine--tRNA ligase [Brevibacterium casei]|uniref:Isoleucine--tRNA ligase n=2 Tax=Bacteria TaxID=2 RepID=A0A2H1IHW8_9MICO|nr:isoleucine--tRNA ligase [Brevibacterium casei]QPR40319.1 isoleucine--tRNA ligase [Brevibacterium casei]QPR44475.1 isoleucine--tRNA ligase [Brevibacterium casei]SMX74706.1 Isoleucyl-tRNA synthetase [Brevibacterium casei CIP 102111]
MTQPLYPKVSTSAFGLSASPNFPEIERAVLEYWKQDDTFQASIDERDPGENGSNEFVFYDGPPFANGLPHYGHLLTGYVKDVVPRFQTMRGKKVDRRFGWDTHGLPAELEAERQLGITDKSEIGRMGLAAFNDACRASVLRYTKEWEEYVTRQGRWVDFDNDYKTLDVNYMESVIWAFKQLWDKGLVYEGYRVLPYCWKDQTPLSSHELRMDDDVYKMRQDPAVTIGYKLVDADEWVLIWTTTPWTVPSNQAVAVNPEIPLVAVVAGDDGAPELQGKTLILAEARLSAYARELGENPEILRTFPAGELVGREYEPPFPYFEARQDDYGQRMHTILSADFVTTEDGTGIVHQSPAFGEEDKELTDSYGILAVRPVDDAGLFDSTVPDYEGQQVFDANRQIIRDLRDHTGPLAGRNALLVRHESYEHSYPHCWRCRNPLIYRAVSSWFVRVTEFKDRMVELNEQINWVPENVKYGQFGKWLENARDWSISRNRFWGSPIPVWISDDPSYPRTDVYGSLAEIEADFGRLPVNDRGEVDLHRPWVDDLTRPNPDDPTGKSTMRRIPEIFDVWFDSGSMSYAQVHYPFENAEWFDNHFPADFIVEYIGQTRGWFYLLHVLATAIFDRPAFRNVISHGIVLGSDGQKMSKSLRNYPDVNEVFDRDGSDAMRWFLMASSILRGGNLVVTEQGIRDAVRQVVLPLWNTWQFFATYSNTADAAGEDAGEDRSGYRAQKRFDSSQVLDRYLLAKTHDLIVDFAAAMDDFDVWAACEIVRSYLDMLTNWYVRRSRRRFWDGGAETHETFDVLYTCLEAFCRVAAPLLPFTVEEIYRGLTGNRSVHLEDYPDASEFPADADLVAAMDLTRDISSTASSVRKANRLRVRLPLSRLVVASGEHLGSEFTAIIADELNVREVESLDLAEAEAAGFSLTQNLVVNARAAGPRLGKQVQAAIKGSKTGDWSVGADGTVTSGGVDLVEGEYTLESVAESGSDGMELAALDSGFLALDTRVTPELEAEGVARDTVRAIQGIRKQLDLNVADRITVVIEAEDSVAEALGAHRDLISAETLATGLDFASLDGAAEVFAPEELPSGTRISVVRA